MTICDMCGRELKEHHSTYQFDTTDIDGSYKRVEVDICDKCDEEICKFVMAKSGKRWRYYDASKSEGKWKYDD